MNSAFIQCASRCGRTSRSCMWMSYVLLTPTYGGGTIDKAVPVQVKRFLNDERNRSGIIGVIASGNTNFGEVRHRGRHHSG